MVKAKKNAKEVVKKTKEKLCKCASTNMFKRVASSIFLIPIVLFALFLGFPFLNLLVLLSGAMFAYEWAKMVENKNATFYAVCYLCPLAIGVLMPITAIFLMVLTFVSLLVWFKAKGEKHRKLLTLGVFYVGVGMSSFLWFAQATGFMITIVFLLIIWATDIGAYFVGTKLKGPKLAPKISPNKTWSGFVGGIVFAFLVTMSVIWIFGASEYATFYMISAVAVSVLGQVGDLVESAIKRKIGVKDSSQLIPGHGGIFDRLDSLLFAAPILVLAIKISVMFF